MTVQKKQDKMYYKFCNEPACWIPITDARVLLQLDGGGEE